MRKGFTLIELMIVIAIIAIIAAIAIPNLLESRITSNEAAAATTLKSGVHPAEVQFQSGNYADDAQAVGGGAGFSIGTAPLGTGGNGIGDFAGLWNQMAGGNVLTGGAPPAAPAIILGLLPITWASANAGGGGVVPGGSTYTDTLANAGGMIGPTLSSYIFLLAASNENGFCATAAPSDGVGSIGRRRFAINAGGVVYQTGATLVNGGILPNAATSPFGRTPFTNYNTAAANPVMTVRK